MDPYRVEKWERTDSAQALKDAFVEGRAVSFAGRVHAWRNMGKAGFADLSDGDATIQTYVRRDDVGETAWEAYTLLDIGDHVGVEGALFLTKTGEKSIHVSRLVPLSKAIEPIPVGKETEEATFGGLRDKEIRYRHRHLDLIANPESRRRLIDRARVVSAVRRYFEDAGFLEVETPLLQTKAGGASARTFDTHYNAFETDVQLRIALELPLKKLICGDLPRVFEIGRVFRNEGVSYKHNPEFTLLEFYEAYVDLERMMERVEECFTYVAQRVFGSEQVAIPGSDQIIDFGKPWHRLDLLSGIEAASGLTAEDLSSLDKAQAALGSREVINPATGKRIVASEERHLGGLIEKLLEVFVEPTLQEPTFVVGYPLETSPLAKLDYDRPGLTKRFEGYVLGREVCNAFAELNDPLDQRSRFERQLAERAKGDDEAHPMDEEFLYALETGMPPTGGCGIGLDRMAMLFTGASSIRDVLMFPMMRPEGSVEPSDG